MQYLLENWVESRREENELYDEEAKKKTKLLIEEEKKEKESKTIKGNRGNFSINLKHKK